MEHCTRENCERIAPFRSLRTGGVSRLGGAHLMDANTRLHHKRKPTKVRSGAAVRLTKVTRHSNRARAKSRLKSTSLSSCRCNLRSNADATEPEYQTRRPLPLHSFLDTASRPTDPKLRPTAFQIERRNSSALQVRLRLLAHQRNVSQQLVEAADQCPTPLRASPREAIPEGVACSSLGASFRWPPDEARQRSAARAARYSSIANQVPFESHRRRAQWVAFLQHFASRPTR